MNALIKEGTLSMICHSRSRGQGVLWTCTLKAFRKGSKVPKTGPSRSDAPAILHISEQNLNSDHAALTIDSVVGS